MSSAITLVGSATFASETSLSNTNNAANFGNALVLNGSTQYGTFASPNPTLKAAGSSWAVKLRFRTTDSSGSLKVMIGNNNPANDGHRAWYLAMLNGVVYSNIGNGAGGGSGGSGFNDGHWHTISISINGSGVAHTAVDGTVLFSQTMLTPTETESGTPGLGIYNGAYLWAGDIDQLEFYNFDAFPSNYTPATSPTPNTTPGLTNIYYFEDSAGTTAADSGTFGIANPLFTAGTATSVTVATSSPYGNTGATTYQWQRSQTCNLSSGGFANVAGATGLTLTDSPGVSATGLWFYRIVINDSIAGVYGSDSCPAPFITPPPPFPIQAIQVGCIGDSMTAGAYDSTATPVQVMNTTIGAIAAQNADLTITCNNYGVSGTHTADWLPSDPGINFNVSGQNLFNWATGAMVTAFGTPSATNPVFVPIMLGTNDASIYLGHTPVQPGPAGTPGTYANNIATITAALVAMGFTPILNCPIPFVIGNETSILPDSSMDLIAGYRAILPSLADNVRIMSGDTNNFIDFAVNQPAYYGDGVIHPNQAGYNVMGANWALALINALNKKYGSVETGSVSNNSGTFATGGGATPTNNASGVFSN